MKIHHTEIKGSLVDEETRCIHYNGPKDRIAIKMYCCKTYFPCHACHEETGCEQPAVWPAELFNEKAVLCGSCKHELTINEYFECGNHCPVCSAAFNPGCSLHRELYFGVSFDQQ